MNKMDLLSELRTNVESLHYGDNKNALVKKCQLYIRKIFGNNSNYLEDLDRISFLPFFCSTGTPKHHYIESFESGKKAFLDLIDVMIEDIQLEESTNFETNRNNSGMIKNNKVFIVHGHDEAMRQTIARFIEKLKLIPIILGEKPSGGVKSILEKIEEYSDVSYAIVLLSPCDEGRKKGSTDLKPRARQNVIAELGYFIGKLGRRNVSILKNGDVEFPSDFLGNCYIEYDESNWEQELFNELETARFNIDANEIM